MQDELQSPCCCCCCYYYCYYFPPPFANGFREPGRPCGPGAGGSPPGGAGRCSALPAPPPGVPGKLRGGSPVEGEGEMDPSAVRARPGRVDVPGGSAAFRGTHRGRGGAQPPKPDPGAPSPPLVAAPRSLPRRSSPRTGLRPPRPAVIRFPWVFQRGVKPVPPPDAARGERSRCPPLPILLWGGCPRYPPFRSGCRAPGGAGGARFSRIFPQKRGRIIPGRSAQGWRGSVPRPDCPPATKERLRSPAAGSPSSLARDIAISVPYQELSGDNPTRYHDDDYYLVKRKN